MDVNLIGAQEPKGFGSNFTNGYPITELENNEIETPYYESNDEGCDTDIDDVQYDTESDYASSDESVISRRFIPKYNMKKAKYENILCRENDFLPE